MRYITENTNAMRSWFAQAIRNKKAEIAKVLAETNGDTETEFLKQDVFTRLTLASQLDSRFHLEDSEIVRTSFCNRHDSKLFI